VNRRCLEDVRSLNHRDPGKTRFAIRTYSYILAYAMGLHFLLGSISVLNALGLGFFYYYPRRIQLAIIDPVADLIVWAVSAGCVCVMAIWPWIPRGRSAVQAGLAAIVVALIAAFLLSKEGSLLRNIILYAFFTVATANFVFIARRSERTLGISVAAFVSRVFVYVLFTLSLIEISSGVHYIVRAFDPLTSIGKLDAQLELQFSYVAYGLVPLLYAGFLFSWAWVPLVRRLTYKVRIFRSVSEASSPHLGLPRGEASGRGWSSFLLDYRTFVVCAVVLFIGYYPYFQNPPWLVGTDAYWRYYDPLLRMNAQGLAGGFAQALKERHPLPLALLYAEQLILHITPFEVVRYAPILLVLALAFATCWFLGREQEMKFVFLVFTFSALSVITAVGIYSSIIANWMALVVWMFFFAYVAARGEDKIGVLDAVALLSMSTLILMIHPWTWGLFAASVLVFVLATAIQERRKGLRAAATLIMVIVVDVVLAALSLTFLAGSEGWRVAEALDLYAIPLRNPVSLLFFWDVLTRLTQVWAAFFSPLSLAVSILGVFYLYGGNATPCRRRLILGWVFVSAIGSILVAPVGYDPSEPTRSESQIWRLLFLTPFQLTVPFGVALIKGYMGSSHMSKESAESKGTSELFRSLSFGILFGVGSLLAWAPTQWRIGLVLFLTSAIAILGLAKNHGNERQFLSDIVLLLVLLVAFNYTARSLAQLLIDPHNYRP